MKANENEHRVLEFINRNLSCDKEVKLDDCSIIKDVPKFLKTQKKIIEAKLSQRQYNEAINRVRKFKNNLK